MVTHGSHFCCLSSLDLIQAIYDLCLNLVHLEVLIE